MKKDPYEKSAEWYDKIFEPLNSGLRQIGLKMYPVKAGMHVLDIGCGTGAHLKLYQKQSCDIYGIDVSPAMIHIARIKLGDAAHIRLGNAAEMEFHDDQFDLILCVTVLHEMPQTVRKQVLEEAKRVLKRDGRILLIDFQPGRILNFKGLVSKLLITLSEVAAGREHYRNYRHYLKNGGLPPLIDAAGFEIENRKTVSGGSFGMFLVRGTAEMSGRL